MTIASELGLDRMTALLLSLFFSSVLLCTVDRLSRLLPALLPSQPYQAAPPCHPLLQAGLVLLSIRTNTVFALPRLLPDVGRGLSTLCNTREAGLGHCLIFHVLCVVK